MLFVVDTTVDKDVAALLVVDKLVERLVTWLVCTVIVEFATLKLVESEVTCEVCVTSSVDWLVLAAVPVAMLVDKLVTWLVCATNKVEALVTLEAVVDSAVDSDVVALVSVETLVESSVLSEVMRLVCVDRPVDSETTLEVVTVDSDRAEELVVDSDVASEVICEVCTVIELLAVVTTVLVLVDKLVIELVRFVLTVPWLTKAVDRLEVASVMPLTAVDKLVMDEAVASVETVDASVETCVDMDVSDDVVATPASTVDSEVVVLVCAKKPALTTPERLAVPAAAAEVAPTMPVDKLVICEACVLSAVLLVVEMLVTEEVSVFKPVAVVVLTDAIVELALDKLVVSDSSPLLTAVESELVLMLPTSVERLVMRLVLAVSIVESDSVVLLRLVDSEFRALTPVKL